MRRQIVIKLIRIQTELLSLRLTLLISVKRSLIMNRLFLCTLTILKVLAKERAVSSSKSNEAKRHQIASVTGAKQKPPAQNLCETQPPAEPKDSSIPRTLPFCTLLI